MNYFTLTKKHIIAGTILVLVIMGLCSEDKSKAGGNAQASGLAYTGWMV